MPIAAPSARARWATANGKSPDERLEARQRLSAPLVADLKSWLRGERALISKHAKVAKAIDYLLSPNHWPGFTRSGGLRGPTGATVRLHLEDGRICLTNNAAERSLRGVARRVSLCTPSSSVCKHWKCIRISNATRAPFAGYGSFDRLRREIIGTDLIGRTRYNLHSRKDAGFDEAPYRVVCDA